jgi:hypothetical protein
VDGLRMDNSEFVLRGPLRALLNQTALLTLTHLTSKASQS